MSCGIDICPSSVRLARRFDAAGLFEATARRFDSKLAIVAPTGTRSYRELLERTGRIRAGLLARGIAAGDRVVLMVPNGVVFVECWWAIVRSGAIVVPVNPRASLPELKKILSQCDAAALVISGPPLEEIAEEVAQSHRSVKVIRDAMSGASLESMIVESDPTTESQIQPLDAPCAIYFTAGSTGQPKGVLRSQQSVAFGLAMLARRLDPSDVLLARAPMAHTGGSLTGPFAILIAGGTLVLPSDTSIGAIATSARTHRVTHLYVHPTIFAKSFLAHCAVQAEDFASLKRLQWTAGPLPNPIRSSLLAQFPGLPLETTFGMTEASNIASYEIRPGEVAKAAHCVGYPLPGAEIRVTDADGNALAPGEEGDVLTRTPTAFDGYWADQAATSAALTRDGWLRTGDVGFLDEDGALHLCGRSREIIKTGGMTVHPAEVEQALADHPSVLDAAVFGVAHEDWDEAVVAAVSLSALDGARAGIAELLDHCRSRLAAYKVPKAIHILAELPRNGSGKVDKRRAIELITLARQPRKKEMT